MVPKTLSGELTSPNEGATLAWSKSVRDRLILRSFRNSHAQRSNSPDYGYVIRIADVPGVAAGFMGRHENQVAVVQLAPAAYI